MVENDREQAIAALRRVGGLALVWFGLTALAFAPTVTVGLTTSVLIAFGFLSFASGLALLANAIKWELLREFQSSVGGGRASERP